MRTGKRETEPGNEYDYLFQTAEGQSIEIKKYAQLEDTVDLIIKVISETKQDTTALSRILEKKNRLMTLENVWSFCFHHIQYRRDAQGIEQVRRPSRTWKDRKAGVDCDCMTVFIGSVLTNLNIPFVVRLTSYSNRDEFEHVYPVAFDSNGNEVIMDCVVHAFNYEVPTYKLKKDIKMKLHYLNGFNDEEENDDLFPEILSFKTDMRGWDKEDDLLGLEGKAERKAKRTAKKQERKASGKTFKDKLKKGLHVVNRLNPGTALLRAGILASMKLNIGKVASKLRFSYWSDEQAIKNNVEMAKFQHLKKIREKLESIFYGAGGKPENLKKSILTGRGNKDRKVSLNGLGAIIEPVNDYQDLQTVIGNEIYNDEIAHLQSGVNGLGAVAAGSAIAAASSVIATIAGLIKKIGSIFNKGSAEAAQEEQMDKEADQEEENRPFSIKKIGTLVQKATQNMGKREILTDNTIPNTQQVKKASVSEYSQEAENENDTSGNDGTSTDIDTKMTDETTTSSEEIDLTPTATEKQASTIPTKSTTTNSGNSSGGAIQWLKDHPVVAVVGAGVVVAGSILIFRSFSPKPEQRSAKALNGIKTKGKKPLMGKKKKSTARAKGITRIELK